MKPSKKKNQTASSTNPPTKTAPSPIVSADVNAIQSTTASSSGNKKGKNKSKKPNNQQEGNKPQNLDADSKGKIKVKYPCLICGGDHF